MKPHVGAAPRPMTRGFGSIVISGASSGIGAALATLYARPGIRMLLVARDAARTEAVALSCRSRGAEVEVALVDVRDQEALTARIGAFDRAAPVDLVIANAGMEASRPPGCPAETLSSSVDQLRVNLEGAVATVTPLVDVMARRRRGAIVLISSLAALQPLADQPAYSAAKAGLAAWGEALRLGLKATGIQVTVVYPGFVASGMAAHYDGWRPFELSCAAAAARIVRGVARGRPAVAFPWPLVWLVRLGRWAPRILRDFVLEAAFRFEITRPAGEADG